MRALDESDLVAAIADIFIKLMVEVNEHRRAMKEFSEACEGFRIRATGPG